MTQVQKRLDSDHSVMVSYSKAAQRLVSNPLFSYLTLFLLQLKVVWHMWDARDLPGGDTLMYFLDGYRWYKQQSIDIVWSPIYTAFYGTFLNITSDLYAVAILHRLVIVFAMSLMVLALMRKLLPHGLAWLIAAWWAILPINFNTLYEVHLFSTFPLLFASLLILYKPAIWTRGGAIAILFGSAVLVRNELSVAAMILALFCVGWEIYQYRTAEQKVALRDYLLGYGVPIAIAVLVILFFYSHSYLKFPVISGVAKSKHTVNICQTYAFGYQQRHPEWKLSPWTECSVLMQQTFGQQLPTLMEALKANPMAMLEHFAWNFSLALNGIQVSLFNATSGSVDPDYAPVNSKQLWVVLPTLLAGISIITGGFLLYRERQYWWRFWLKERMWGWVTLVSAASVVPLVIIPTQRPRPSYMFSLAILLMACVGMSLFVIFHRWSGLRKLNVLVPTIAIILLLAVPVYYSHKTERPTLEFYRRLLPFREIVKQRNTTLIARSYNWEACLYLKLKDLNCPSINYADENQFLQSVTDAKSLSARLRHLKINLFYVDEPLLAKLSATPSLKEFLTHPRSVGWRLVARQNEGNSKWMLLRRKSDKA